jgi:hypothetical protein
MSGWLIGDFRENIAFKFTISQEAKKRAPAMIRNSLKVDTRPDTKRSVRDASDDYNVKYNRTDSILTG